MLGAPRGAVRGWAGGCGLVALPGLALSSPRGLPAIPAPGHGTDAGGAWDQVPARGSTSVPGSARLEQTLQMAPVSSRRMESVCVLPRTRPRSAWEVGPPGHQHLPPPPAPRPGQPLASSLAVDVQTPALLGGCSRRSPAAAWGSRGEGGRLGLSCESPS